MTLLLLSICNLRTSVSVSASAASSEATGVASVSASAVSSAATGAAAASTSSSENPSLPGPSVGSEPDPGSTSGARAGSSEGNVAT